jgi:hypothetical protein
MSVGTPAAKRDALRVLVFTFGDSPICDLRVRAPLTALFESGDIAGYTVVYGNGHPAGPQSFDAYDCIWIQRDYFPWLGTRLVERGLPYLLDLDDLVMAVPAYSRFIAQSDVLFFSFPPRPISQRSSTRARRWCGHYLPCRPSRGRPPLRDAPSRSAH